MWNQVLSIVESLTILAIIIALTVAGASILRRIFDYFEKRNGGNVDLGD